MLKHSIYTYGPYDMGFEFSCFLNLHVLIQNTYIKTFTTYYTKYNFHSENHLRLRSPSVDVSHRHLESIGPSFQKAWFYDKVGAPNGRIVK